MWGIKIGFIGLGKLGYPCAEAMVDRGFDVTGYDTAHRSSSKINITDDILECVVDKDFVFVAVPTPHEKDYDGSKPTSQLDPKDFDYDTVKGVLKRINKHMTKDQAIVLISTVLPGTIRSQLAPLVENTKLLYNPYLIAMGTVGWDMLNPEMVMIGTKKGNPDTAVLAKKLESMYLQMCDNMPRVEIGSWEEVEAIKIFYNTFISAKLSLVNMIQDVAVKLGNMNVDVVTNALANSTHRITSGKYMKPGMGDGGPCHPRDNIALRFLAKKLDLHYDLFSAIMESREIQAKNMAKEILKYGNVVYFTSDSYKEGTQLTDGSYSLLVQHYVRELGGIVSHGNAEKIDVIFRVHNNDQFSTDENTIVFDPWRTYPKAKNVVYYGDTKNV